MNSKPRTYIELSKKNLVNNWKTLKKIAKPGTKFSVAIKGNAYGHGLEEVAKILDPYVDYFQVDSVEELRKLRKVSKKKTLLLGYVKNSDLEEASRLGSIISIFSLEELRALGKIGVKEEIHVPVDAYLGREGFLPENLLEFFKELKKWKNISLTGIYAHFANIEDTNNFTHAEKQIKRYAEAVAIAEKHGFNDLTTHISATSGLLVYEKNSGTHPLIRLGIGVYGLWPSEHIKFLYKNKTKLLPVLSLKTHVAQVKMLPAGHTVGYGLTHMTYKPTKIAVLPVGYADGFERGLSNKGEVIIQGKKCKVIGRIAMNMTVVDVTRLKDVKAEDEVVLIGRQGKEEITAEEMAGKIDSINYEAVTRLSPLLPRIVV